ncbi:unnamed protein product [Protopolystoma xenopodis]|uniref:Uncharacterized protein n=1 Tax=Protopolystoma xenopodis TaxID=117903 RepID=A0A448XJ55_9PLAT|nr:unnamed protein product [Protopolystoma xenopodis]
MIQSRPDHDSAERRGEIEGCDKGPEDDPTFLAPNRMVAKLLRMLADSRILSLGELDQVAEFVAKRRVLLSGSLQHGRLKIIYALSS